MSSFARAITRGCLGGSQSAAVTPRMAAETGGAVQKERINHQSWGPPIEAGAKVACFRTR